ncbi:NAD-dependent protein deacylase [Limosilactobacillus gorillae]|jgi:NAD-dependent deacetylase|uniref:NAD-dependent protein deacylase n=1 Tax=Limosilactobacillus gorillae TaxID=1450649 RepID=UPI000B25129F|nr:NAD-dependent protein deacylase [Limosilactobacillus gorillae]
MLKQQALFDSAHHIVFLTGAGVSTASGIPDFRSANGLYKQNQNAEYFLSHRFFMSDPAGFYDFCKNNLYFPEARPNVIHEKQAALTRLDKASVITQNIDNLYELAGTKHLVDFHGNLFDVYCEKCHAHVPVEEYLQNRLHKTDQGSLRPNIVLYDEGIPERAIRQSLAAIQEADLVVVVGTSMKVYPFAGLLEYVRPDVKILAVNQEPLNLPGNFEMVVEDAVDFFAQLKVN